MKKLNKLDKLEAAETFIQVNFLKGFSYIDTAGEIINLYQNKEGEVSYDMNAQRLVFPTKNFNNSVKELKISNIDLWCKFTNPSLEASIKDYLGEAKKIFKLTKVKDVKRVGVRRNYIFVPKAHITDLSPLINIDTEAVNLLSLSYTYKHSDEVSGTIRIEILKDETGNRAVLFDVDIDSKNDIKIDGLEQCLAKINKAYESKKLLNFVNSVIEGL